MPVYPLHFTVLHRFTRAIVITFAMGAGMVTSALAQPMEHGLQRNPERRVEHIARAVNATPEQKDQLLKLARSAQAEMQPLREQRRAAHHQGMQLLAASTVDRVALEQVRQRQMALSDVMSKRMAQHLADMSEVLTPAQRTQLAQVMQKHAAQRGHHGHQGGWAKP
jgi:Spy/CpxP family protein refolding chaperone